MNLNYEYYNNLFSQYNAIIYNSIKCSKRNVNDTAKDIKI